MKVFTWSELNKDFFSAGADHHYIWRNKSDFLFNKFSLLANLMDYFHTGFFYFYFFYFIDCNSFSKILWWNCWHYSRTQGPISIILFVSYSSSAPNHQSIHFPFQSPIQYHPTDWSSIFFLEWHLFWPSSESKTKQNTIIWDHQGMHKLSLFVPVTPVTQKDTIMTWESLFLVREPL